jgi:hypothetical protein
MPFYPDFSSDADKLLASATPESMWLASPPNEHIAIEWLSSHLQPGAKIVELFAEVGRFAWQARAAGYQVRLADPLVSHVSVLRNHGFTALQAAHPTDLPADWGDSDAVVILESIVRLPDPGAFVAGLREKFPRALLFLTAPSLRRPLKIEGVDRRGGYPDFLTRWTLPALRELLVVNGYATNGFAITPQLLSGIGRHGWRGRLWLIFLTLLLVASREYEFSVAAWGTPGHQPR